MLDNLNPIYRSYLTFFLIIGLAILALIVGSVLVQLAYGVNATAIDEIQTELTPELELTNNYSVFWLIFMLLIMATFMATMLKMREDRETIFFSLGAVIMSILISLVFLSPVTFSYEVSQSEIIVEEIEWLDGSITYNSAVKNTVDQIIVIPNDTSFKLITSMFFIGISLFCGLYTIFIVTNFPFKQSKHGQ